MGTILLSHFRLFLDEDDAKSLKKWAKKSSVSKGFDPRKSIKP